MSSSGCGWRWTGVAPETGLSNGDGDDWNYIVV
jgi:hypothetical protein